MMKKTISLSILIVAAFWSIFATASDEYLLFPESLKIPLIGPSKPANICMSLSTKLEAEKELNAKIDVDCVRLSVSEVEAYDEKNDVFLLLAYANVLHNRGWETTDMVSGTPLLKSPQSNNGCTQHIMITGGFLSDNFPDGGHSEDEGQYIFLSLFINDEGAFCGVSLRNTNDE